MLSNCLPAPSLLWILVVPTCTYSTFLPVPIIIALTTQSLTHRRVCEVVLNGDKTFSLVQQKYKVSDKLKSGEATALFGAYAAGYL